VPNSLDLRVSARAPLSVASLKFYQESLPSVVTVPKTCSSKTTAKRSTRIRSQLLQEKLPRCGLHSDWPCSLSSSTLLPWLMYCFSLTRLIIQLILQQKALSYSFPLSDSTRSCISSSLILEPSIQSLSRLNVAKYSWIYNLNAGTFNILKIVRNLKLSQKNAEDWKLTDGLTVVALILLITNAVIVRIWI